MVDFADTRVTTAGIGAETGVATTTKSAGQCSVTIGDTTVVVECARDLTVAVGDVLLVVRQGAARWAIARLFTAAPPPPPVEETPDPGPPPKPVTVTGRLVCVPTYTGSFRNGKWRTDDRDVFQGRFSGSSFGRNTGAAFYGSTPRSLKAGTVVKRARIRVQRLSGGSFAAKTATLRLVTEATKPSGAPTLGASANGPTLAPGQTDIGFSIPVSWAQDIVDGTKGGLAVHIDDDEPYMQFAGKETWSPAFTMTIDWERTT